MQLSMWYNKGHVYRVSNLTHSDILVSKQFYEYASYPDMRIRGCWFLKDKLQ